MVEPGDVQIMLITNFAAGELAENLFGRVDLPQYYSGVSRLENFDVIPTGGIERRNGFRRLRKMDGEGRIIPFIVDRERHYLLYLSPGKIQVYLEKQLLSTMTSTSAVPLYEDMSEISEVQYAQESERMVLVQKYRNPLILIFDKATGGITIQKFVISSEVSVIYSGGDTVTEHETDEVYENSGWLRSDKNWPSCVSFFQGRLVFAGTENRPQRVFASRVNDINNFSTYKMFISDQYEHVVIYGTVTGAGTLEQRSTIILDSIDEGAKFTRSLDEYYCDNAAFFPAGTKITKLSATSLELSNASNIQAELSAEESAALNQKLVAWNLGVTLTNPDNPAATIIANGTSAGVFIQMTARYGISNNGIYYFLYSTGGSTWQGPMNYFTEADARAISTEAEDNPQRVYDRIRGSGQLSWYANIYEDNIREVARIITSNIRSFLIYTFRLQPFYGNTFPEINDKIRVSLSQPLNAYISFYAKSVVIDRHPTPDDGFTFEIASDMSDSIRWIGQNKNLLVGTETAEWIVPAGVNAVNVQAILNSRYGSDKIQGTSIGDAVCFVQSGRRALIEYYIPQQDNNFRANNMAMLSRNMLHESQAHDIDFISAPYTKIFISREDGTLAALLYERGSGTFAWGRITTAGKIKSVATLPGETGYDEVYFIVERDGGYYLERLDERRRVHLDAYEAWTGSNADYSVEALVYDEAAGKVYRKGEAPPPGPDSAAWIGYQYTSLVRSMPVLANDRMKPNNIKRLMVRFLDSYMPRVKSLPNGEVNSIPREEPCSGVVQIPFPGVFDRDVFFELIHDKPTRCQILAVNAEVT
jgi:hypothetical protein